MTIKHTRAMISAALSGALNGVRYRKDPIFGVEVPAECPGVPHEVLWPRDTWTDPAAYDRTAKHVARLFAENFEQFRPNALETTVAAGPRVD